MHFTKNNSDRYIIDVMYGNCRVGSMTREPGETTDDVFERLEKDFPLIVRQHSFDKVWGRLHFSNPYILTGKPK